LRGLRAYSTSLMIGQSSICCVEGCVSTQVPIPLEWFLGILPEGALCASLSNRAFSVNIRSARKKCKPLAIHLCILPQASTTVLRALQALRKFLSRCLL
jgi:hypothetical protein